MPPPENRPLDIGRPMNIEYDTYSPTNVNLKQLLEEMVQFITFKSSPVINLCPYFCKLIYLSNFYYRHRSYSFIKKKKIL